jgi:hypothetical protein
MNYDIKIANNYEGKGQLELDRVGFLAKHLKEVSKKSLLLQIFGYSKVSLDNKLKKQLNVFMTSLSESGGETLLTLDASNFSELPVQLDAFRDKSQLKTLTPVSLIIQTFNAALDEKGDKNLLDEPIVNELIRFKQFFETDNEVIYLSNRGSIPEAQFGKKSIEKIVNLYKETPKPENIIIHGTIDEMKYSRSQLVLLTKESERLVVMQKNKDNIEEVKSFFGRTITIKGKAFFKPGGQLSYVEMESFSEPKSGDEFFSKKPKQMPVQQQIAMQLKAGKKSNPLDDIFGKWPGIETEEEFTEMLKSLD